MEGRDFVIPDDVNSLAVPVLAHRLNLSAESELEGISDRRIVEDIVARTEAPHCGRLQGTPDNRDFFAAGDAKIHNSGRLP
jgi:MoxR-like ATPase